jgi:hypothetical protein
MLPTRRQLELAIKALNTAHDCWTVRPGKKKWATIHMQTRQMAIHRFLLSLTSEGQGLRHRFHDANRVCENADCVRPTHFVNMQESVCLRGHVKDAKNTYLMRRIHKKTGKLYLIKHCRKCGRDRARAHGERERAKR